MGGRGVVKKRRRGQSRGGVVPFITGFEEEGFLHLRAVGSLGELERQGNGLSSKASRRNTALLTP